MLYDIGKIGRKPTPLGKAWQAQRLASEQRCSVMQSWETKSCRGSHQLRRGLVEVIIEQSHERWDGQGYPTAWRRPTSCWSSYLLRRSTSSTPLRRTAPTGPVVASLRRGLRYGGVRGPSRPGGGRGLRRRGRRGSGWRSSRRSWRCVLETEPIESTLAVGCPSPIASVAKHPRKSGRFEVVEDGTKDQMASRRSSKSKRLRDRRVRAKRPGDIQVISARPMPPPTWR